MKLSNGSHTEDVSGEELKKLQEDFKGYSLGLVKVQPQNILLPKPYERWAEEYLNFKFRPSDVVISTYPKCGTTWMQEVVWTMLHNPNLDNPAAENNLAVRSPFLEFDAIVSVLTQANGHIPAVVESLKKLDPKACPDDGLFLGLAKNVPDRKVIKTHLLFSLLPSNLLDTCKVVYVARNPKDMVCSYLHHHRIIKVHDFKGSDQEFVDCICDDNVLYGAYHSNLAEAWARREHKNILIVFFEDFKKDPVAEMKKINTFLGADLTEDQLKKISDFTDFKSMSKRLSKRLTESSDAAKEKEEKAKKETSDGQGVPGIFEKKKEERGFYRKGEVGSWQTDLTSEQAQQIDRWVQKNFPGKVGFQFKYTL